MGKSQYETENGEGSEDGSLPSPEKAKERLCKLPGGLRTLLDVEGRMELPPVPKGPSRSLLHDLVEFNPDTYAQYIMFLRAGAYYHTAAEAIGIEYDTIRAWAERGKKDLTTQTDSYYSRFVLDVRRAVASTRVRAEMILFDQDVKKWLTLGPGKMFGNEWSDPATRVPQGQGGDQDQIEERPFIDPPRLENKTKDDGEYELSTDEMEATREALRLSGMESNTITNDEPIDPEPIN